MATYSGAVHENPAGSDVVVSLAHMCTLSHTYTHWYINTRAVLRVFLEWLITVPRNEWENTLHRWKNNLSFNQCNFPADIKMYCGKCLLVHQVYFHFLCWFLQLHDENFKMKRTLWAKPVTLCWCWQQRVAFLHHKQLMWGRKPSWFWSYLTFLSTVS